MPYVTFADPERYVLSAKKNMDGEYIQCTVFQSSSLAAVSGENCSAAMQCIVYILDVPVSCGVMKMGKTCIMYM